MGNYMKIAKFIFILFISLAFLSACGGSGETLSRDTDTDSTDGSVVGNTSASVSMAISLLDQQGNTNTVLTQGEPLNVNTRVLDSTGAPVVGQLINYSVSQSDLVVFNNDTATGLTNSDGIATIQINVGSLSGSGSITASIDTGEVNTEGTQTTQSVTIGFSSQGTPEAISQNLRVGIAIFDQDGITQNQLTSTSPLTVAARVLDATGVPIQGILVTYALNVPTLATFSNDVATGLTDSNGLASIMISAGTTSGSGTVTATVENADPAVIGFTTVDTNGQTSDAPTLAVSIEPVRETQNTNLAQGSPLAVNALVLNASGEPMPGVLVSYTLAQEGLAVFNNDTGTALTNNDGLASIQMQVGSLAGSGLVTVTVDGLSPVTAGFTSLGAEQVIPHSIELYANAVQLASSGGDTIELIAVIKNEQNVLLPNIPISFAVDENASLSNLDPVTGDDGTARAFLTTQNDSRNRELTVIASSAELSDELSIDVVGTEVNINGPGSVIINDSAPITLILSDSDGVGIPNQTLNLSASLGTLNGESSNVNVLTGANGIVEVTFLASEAGSAVITANASDAKPEDAKTFELYVQEDDFSFIDLPLSSETIDTGTDRTLSLRWFKNNQPFVNGDVTVTTSRGDIAVPNVVTDANGIAEVVINSTYAGPASISAVGEDSEGNEVTARGSIEFIATDVSSIFVDATPDIIGPEGQTTTITAILRDDIGNLVQGKTVNFSLDADSTGGSISPNTATTDSNGIASTVYTSNAVSADNGVTISAQSDGVTGSTDLTVGDRAFDISLGTGSVIEVLDNSTYMKEFTVFVTDASGRPIANTELSATLTPTYYDASAFVSGGWEFNAVAFIKGGWSWNEDDSVWDSVIVQTCANEDIDRDGILDTRFDDNGNVISTEDLNGDGLLTPGNVASVSFAGNVSRTDNFGQATVQIRYPKQYGNWTRVLLSVYGQSAGSESSQSQIFTLAVAADDITQQFVRPPSSPYGSALGCDNTD